MIAGGRESGEWFAEFRDQFVVIGGVALVALVSALGLKPPLGARPAIGRGDRGQVVGCGVTA